MECMSGGNLQLLLIDDDVVLRMNLRLGMSSEIANGISFLRNFSEEHRLVHGDLKPDNILLTSNLNCKIADFGGAKVVKYTMSSTTETEATHGQMSKAYAAPELLVTTRKPKPKQPLSFNLKIEYLEAVKKGEHPGRLLKKTMLHRKAILQLLIT